ncbi:hypothetical protein [Bacillus wiedmannii]|uniref:Uncharacterized protein n=1 Tax=Bacillus wiedmannii TaxID=1890302 RepID=A0A2C4H9F3_9BACI|nr:hypothetical protein [Bacillus wiedmannii]PEJ05381.1 hypothetical protein CN684_20560 [Bacillus wiedmannii]PEM24036.1 hypothetical protein CN617_25645 [Bacillus wiedmannii]PHC63402.1 hypothetical protein COF35_26030 [Bacillus wiedmannii]HDR7963745.1 hypothetical protein [Bacillus wiedmannii]HDR7964728.1 hypothetical protein [Bacillus wiedmannii]
MLLVQLSQYLLKESKPVLHTDGKRVYMLKDEGLSPYPIHLNHPSMIGVGTNWNQHTGFEEIIKRFIGANKKIPMYMLFETYLRGDFIEGFLEENKLHFELVFTNKKRDTNFFKVFITNSDDITTLMKYFFQSAQDALYTLLTYSADCKIISNRTDEIEIKADSFYPSFSFMYDAQELFIIGGEEKWSDTHYIKRFFHLEQITDELIIDLRK